MAFQVPVAGVDRANGRGRRTVGAALLLLLSVVAVAIATGGPSAGPTAAAVAASGGPPAADASGPGAPVARSLPGDVTCRDVDPVTCLRMARAAMRALPDDAPAAVDATVWRSLLCNDNFDCPPSFLDGSTPLGSVIIRFTDGGPRAAINVVEGRTGPIRRAPRAWIVGWMPEAG